MASPASPPAPAPRHGVWTWIPPLSLALWGLLVPRMLSAYYGFAGIGGSDPGMWEAAARAKTWGEPSTVAPLFPLLIGLLQPLGLGWDGAGAQISALAFAALGPATWLLARRLGAPPPLALLAGSLPLLEPWLALGALQCQPDTLTALIFVLALLSALAWTRSASWSGLLALILAVGLLPSTREHAPPLAVALLLPLVAARGPGPFRVGVLLLGLCAALLTPLLLGEPFGLPWEQPWVQARYGEVFHDFFSTGAPAFLGGTPRGFREAFAAAYAQGDRLRIAWLHASLSFHSGWSPWLWLPPALVGLLLLKGRARWVMALAFTPLLAVFGGAQQPRHVAVLVPLAAACWVASLQRFRLQERVALVLATLGLCSVCALNLDRAAADHRHRAEQRQRLRAFSEELCERVGPEALSAGGNPRPSIYCERPRRTLAEAERHGGPIFWVGPLPQQRPDAWPRLRQAGWALLPMQSDLYPVYLRPWGDGPPEAPSGGATTPGG
jgi:hypothetical protein